MKLWFVENIKVNRLRDRVAQLCLTGLGANPCIARVGGWLRVVCTVWRVRQSVGLPTSCYTI